VIAVDHAAHGRVASAAGELGKLPAFLRRDFLVAWSYRTMFFADVAALAFQALSFYFIGLMVDPAVLPSFGGERATYMEFVAVGIALGVFIQLGLGRVAAAIRNEQLMGTLESLLMTPTHPTTIQLGSVVYELIYIPVRTALFLAVVAVAFGLSFEAAGLLPALAILLLFIPFVWGLGVASAAATLTFKRGSGGIGLGVTVLTLFSGAYFPLDLLPSWATTLAELNPIAIAIEGMRDALLGGAGWSEAGRALLVIAPVSALSLVGGLLAFRASLRRERRRGTLGLY
jgi:ABC-type polysaccharide/polyol phosphate export permease